MSERPTNGLGLSGSMRLERIEDKVNRLDDKVDDLGNEVHQLLSLQKQVRGLEIRFYSILAGLIAALGVIVYNRGGIP